MEFILGDFGHSVHEIMEIIGYRSQGSESRGEEHIMVKKLGKNDYPRFHLSVTIRNGEGHGFFLYLENSSQAHDVVHEGTVVEEEMKRIKNLLMEPPKQ